MRILETINDHLEKIPEKALLGANAAFGGLVLLAHGGALLIVRSGKFPLPPDYASTVSTLVPYTLPIAALMVIGSIIALIRPTASRVIFPFQAVVLLISGVAALGWSGSIAVKGIPGGSFSWTPGILTGWMFYSIFLFGRYVLPSTWRTGAIVKYAPFLGLMLALPIDLAVFLRMLLKMRQMVGAWPN